MIEPKKIVAADLIFEKYLKHLFKKYFSNFYLVDLPSGTPIGSVLYTPNHFSWWDGFFAYLLNKKVLKKDFHILMLEEQLKKYYFFKYLGAFSIEPSSLRSIYESLNFSKCLLERNNTSLFFYPQGEIEPFENSKISIKSGAKFFNSIKDLTIQPIAFKIYYSNMKKPDVVCKFGESIKTNGDNLLESFKVSFIRNISELKEYRVVDKEILTKIL